MAVYGMLGLIIGSLAFIINIAGLAIPFWLHYTKSDLSIEINTGLWKWCSSVVTSVSKEEACITIQELQDLKNNPDLPLDFNASRGLEILAVLLTAAALFVAFVEVFVKKDKRILMVFAGGSALLAGPFMIAGAGVFVTSNAVKRAVFGNLPLDSITPHTGFALSIYAGVLNIAAAILFFVDTMQPS